MAAQKHPKTASTNGRPAAKYVEQKESVLQLASSIVEAQEDKTRTKLQKRVSQVSKQALHGAAPGAADNSKKHKNKLKLKDAKALIASQKAARKKERAKVRQVAKKAQNGALDVESPSVAAPVDPPRKKVSFA
ncbi:hypothetical protein FA95DRAFT_88415 [Auriscalpium vulgare]|uniref:Uncharacterized protein n=1 Tax=Auriscalpium vulgare TaxID=40419 RepID=A0ACB8RPC6_9AGAM|nr:hypothetical protein FA95DRAFT_88415 [Auriscalpium vulgare]